MLPEAATPSDHLRALAIPRKIEASLLPLPLCPSKEGRGEAHILHLRHVESHDVQSIIGPKLQSSEREELASRLISYFVAPPMHRGMGRLANY